MIILSSLVVTIVLLVFTIVFKTRWYFVLIGTIASLLITSLIIAIDYQAKTLDTEVWSGIVVDWKHNEEWDEWHPPVTSCSTDSDGNVSCTTTAGYWEHHYATNYIKTTDAGWIRVNRTPDGRKMDDSFPNRTEELMDMWEYGFPSASTHTYRNKVQASYSIYKHPEIDLDKYTDLPEYPKDVRGYVHIDRIVGDVPNKKEALYTLAEKNAWLNQMILDPENPNKKRSWKQVNLIFVNLKDKPSDYGFALQDYWEGGNKNDFVVAFSTDENNKIQWAYPFSWSESELLKIEVRDYMLDLESTDNFVPIVEDIAQLVSEKFERKQFSDFNYLKIEVGTVAKVIIWIANILIILLVILIKFGEQMEREGYRAHRW